MQHRISAPNERRRAHFSSVFVVALSLTRLACGENPASTPPLGSGGSPTGGQATASGGLSTSGTTATGGTVAATGGTATGGAVTATGGAVTASGGAIGNPTGGSSTGGTSGGSNTGGTLAQGGNTPGSGGKSGGGAGAGGTAGGASPMGGSAGKASGGSAGSINVGGGGSDLCPRVDTANPPKMLTLSGSLGAHDPAVLAVNGTFYLFATGLAAKTSGNLMAWQNGSAPARPAWVAQQVSGATNLWAPDISYFGGNYHLYYSASTFGSNHSCIGHATRASMTTGAWTDHGSVICSNPSGGSSDNWNAIDPNVIVDEAGTPWLNFGSFWGGIKMIKLDATGARSGTELLSLAARPQNSGALEAPFIIHQCGYYYLFVSFDHCCDSPWDYNIRVGRSTSVTGPYTDKAGTAMMQGGGSLLVTGNSTWQGPGHNAVIVTATGAYNVYHALNPSSHASSLRIAEMAWDAQGWPVSAGP